MKYSYRQMELKTMLFTGLTDPLGSPIYLGLVKSAVYWAPPQTHWIRWGPAFRRVWCAEILITPDSRCKVSISFWKLALKKSAKHCASDHKVWVSGLQINEILLHKISQKRKKWKGKENERRRRGWPWRTHELQGSAEEKEAEIQDYPASSRLFDLLLVRKDLEMSM